LALLAGCLDRDPVQPGESGATPELVPARAWIETGGRLELVTDRPSGYSLRVSPSGIVGLAANVATGLKPGTATVEALFPVGRRSSTLTVLDPVPPLSAQLADEALTDASLLGVWAADPSTAFAAGTEGVILVTRDGGASWTRMHTGTLANFTGIWGSSATDVFAVGGQGTIIHWDGVAWRPQASPTQNALLDVYGFGPHRVFAVGVDVALAYDGVRWTPMPGDLSAAELWAIWGPSPEELFATGQNGVALRWEGTRWTRMTTPTGFVLFGLWGTASNDVFAVGIRGTVLHFDGSAWSVTPVPSGADFFAIGGTSRSNIVVVGNGGTVMSHNGVSWTMAPQRATIENLRAVWFDQAGTAWIAGWSGTVIERSASGWRNLVTAPILFAAAQGSDGATYAVGNGGAVLRQSSVGPATPVPVPTRRDLYGIARTATGELVIVGDSGTILSSTDGVQWRDAGSPSRVLLRSIWADRTNPDAVYVVGERGTIIRRVGGRWVTLPSPTTQFLRHVFGASPNVLVAVGDSGTAIRSEGSGWSLMTTPVTARLRGVWGTGADDLMAVGELGTTIRFDGRTWYSIPSGTTKELRAVAGTGPIDLYAVGESGTGLRFDGSQWESIPLPRPVFFLGLSPAGGSSLTAVGTNRTTVRLTR
jgi:photosystem II stability/assembly factor-like uncharacterized protein